MRRARSASHETGSWALVPLGRAAFGGVPDGPDWWGPGEDLLAQVGAGWAATPQAGFAKAVAAFAAASEEWRELAQARSGRAAESYQDNLPARYEAMLAIYWLAREFQHACSRTGREVELPRFWPE